MEFKTYNNCTVCKKKILTENKVKFDKFPITEIFLNKAKSNRKINFKQRLNYCSSCDHLSLAYQYETSNFYNDTYLNSSHSFSNLHSNKIFFNFINKYAKKRKYKIIEFGANDLNLAETFANRGSLITAIDPCVVMNKKIKNIRCIKKIAEKVDINEVGYTPEIVLCSHTLEHVEDPHTFLKHICKNGDDNTKYFFQFPSCESIIERRAFDQIHHQHINLFSLNSITKILNKLGLSIIDYDKNEYHYGALMIYFKVKKNIKNLKFIKKKINLSKKFKEYETYMSNIINIVKNYKDKKNKIYAIGASLMTPILNYHLKGLLDLTDNILDDDKKKFNKYFPNINSKIKSLSKTDLTDSVVIIAATASSITTRKLISLVDNKKAKIIIVPTLTF